VSARGAGRARRAEAGREAPWVAAAAALTLALALGLAPAVARAPDGGAAQAQAPRADLVWLIDGGPPIEGRITSEDASEVRIEVASGRIRIPRERVERVERGAGALPPATPIVCAQGDAPGTPAATAPPEGPAAGDAVTPTAALGIEALARRACALEREGRAGPAEVTATALVREIRRQLLLGAATEPAERARAADAAREALAALPPRLLTVALEEAAGLPLDLLAPCVERALLLSRPPPLPAVRPDPAPSLALRRAVGEALCHAVTDADAPLDPRALRLVRGLLDEPDDGVRMLVLEHIDGCAKTGVPLVLVDLLEGDPAPEIRARALAALRRIARGVDHGDDAALWRGHFTTQRVTPR